MTCQSLQGTMGVAAADLTTQLLSIISLVPLAGTSIVF